MYKALDKKEEILHYRKICNGEKRKQERYI